MNKNVMFISPNALESYRKSLNSSNALLKQLRSHMVWKVVPSPNWENVFFLEPDYGLGYITLIVNKHELDTYFEEI